MEYTALYWSESWALKKCDEILVTAFEMWETGYGVGCSIERKTKTWTPEKIGISEEKGNLAHISAL